MTILLFDVDGTLAHSGKQIPPEIHDIFEDIYKFNNIQLGIVGGGSYHKIIWQLGNAIKYFKYIFSECGSVIHINGKLISTKNMLDNCDRELINNIIKKCLFQISQMPIVYHGNQIDIRNGLIYVSPPGIQATDYERNIFIQKDKQFNLRQKLIKKLIKIDVNHQLEITIGGTVGIAVYPKGWNKSQVMDYFIDNHITDLFYYFGDKTHPDGNDYPLFIHPMVNGVTVVDYLDTITKLKEILPL